MVCHADGSIPAACRESGKERKVSKVSVTRVKKETGPRGEERRRSRAAALPGGVDRAEQDGL